MESHPMTLHIPLSQNMLYTPPVSYIIPTYFLYQMLSNNVQLISIHYLRVRFRKKHTKIQILTCNIV